jgi:hypothetical protein
MLMLSLTDKALNRILCRKDPQAVFLTQELQDWRTASPEAKERILIVCTTSLQETGRDHDYDWVVTEPYSTRAAVQLAGRTRRHRGVPDEATPNFIVLEQPLRAVFEHKNVVRDFEVSRETIEGKTPLHLVLDTTQQASASIWTKLTAILPGKVGPNAYTLDQAQTYLPASFFASGLHAASCLLDNRTEGAALATLEQVSLQYRMRAPLERCKRMSLRSIFESGKDRVAELFWGRHAEAVQFRRQDGVQSLFSLNYTHAGARLVVVAKDAFGVVRGQERVAAVGWTGGTDVRHPERALLRFDLWTSAEVDAELGRVGLTSAEDQVMALAFQARISPDKCLTADLYFDPLLGACESEVEF